MDVDNIRPNVTNGESDVLGTKGFIAPEIIQGKSTPNTKTDRFSIAVMLFCLWCKQNPFEGTKVILYEGSNELMDLYANPVFIFHPTDKSNTAEKDPNDSWAKNCFAWVRAWWEAIPSILKKQFTECFTEELDPNKRNTTESMWITIFERILTEGHLDVCPKCKNKIASESSKCVFCGAKHKPEQPQAPVKKNIGGAQPPVGGQNNAQPQKQTGVNNAAPKNNTPVPTPATLKNRIVIDENGSRSNAIDLKVGNVIAGADISSRLASMRKVLEVCTSPNDASLLALRNLTYYAFRVVYKDGTSNMLEPERAVLIRKVEKIILPYDIILYIE
jgi:serine/threonine protein kinase